MSIDIYLIYFLYKFSIEFDINKIYGHWMFCKIWLIISPLQFVYVISHLLILFFGCTLYTIAGAWILWVDDWQICLVHEY
jgi:hypothetical protein